MRTTPAPAPTPAQAREEADPVERSQPIPLLVAAITSAVEILSLRCTTTSAPNPPR
mgnify:CR=1 FL=1